MAQKYSQSFTLKDIFNNQRLVGKLPLVNYREVMLDNGKISRRTKMDSVTKLVADNSKSSARPFYKSFSFSKSGDNIIIDGNSDFELSAIQDAVYNSLIGIKALIRHTANDGDMIRSALKEAEKNKRKYGIDSKLFLKVGSMQQIEAMSDRQLSLLMNQIIDNIYYGDNYPETQKKYRIKELMDSTGFKYETWKESWKNEVGG